MSKASKVSKRKPAREIDLHVQDRASWANWLEANHRSSAGVWLVFAKKGSTLSTPTYQEALEEALCFGWIDGQKGARDTERWAQRFSPRGPQSVWSQINVEKIERLIAAGKVRAAGLAAVETAKQNGRWARAYASQRSAGIPDDLQAALDASAKAKAFFATLSSANRYAILFRLQTAKKIETRHKRLAQFVAMLERGETLHPQRR